MEIRVDPGVKLIIRVSGATKDHEGFSCQVILWDKSVHHWMHARERLVCTGIAAARRYRIWIGPTDDGLAAYRENVRGDAGEVVLPLVPGLSIKGRIALPEQVARTWVSAGIGDHEVFGTVAPDGSFEIKGLPDTEFVIKVTVAPVGDRYLRARTRARPGDDVSLTPR